MRIAPWMRVTISAVAVGIIVWRVPVEALWAAVQSMDTYWLMPALLSALASLAVRNLKWQRLLRAAGSRASSRDVTRSLFGGFALGVVTPGRVGEWARCVFIPEGERAPVIPLNILDRILDSWSVFTYAVMSLLLGLYRPGGVFAAAVWLALWPVVLGLPHLISSLGDGRWWNEHYRAQFRAARQRLSSIRIAPFAGWALVSTTFDVLTFLSLLRAFHSADFKTALVTYPWIVMASGIPLSLGGLGLREGAATLLLARYAIPAAVAADVALFLFAFLTLIPALIGSAWLLLTAAGQTTPLAGFGLRGNAALTKQLGISAD